MIWKFLITDKESELAYAFDWYSSLPGFLKSFVDPYTAKDQELFIKDLLKGINFAAYEDNKLKAIVNASLVLNETNKVEGHLFCSKDSSIDFLSSAVSYAREQCLKQFEIVVCHVLRRHKLLQIIMNRAGFLDSGLRGWQNIYKGNGLEVMYYYTLK